ncbi:hypothetical protein Trydic_g19576 [Trypoxylus dichotomus]
MVLSNQTDDEKTFPNEDSYSEEGNNNNSQSKAKGVNLGGTPSVLHVIGNLPFHLRLTFLLCIPERRGSVIQRRVGLGKAISPFHRAIFRLSQTGKLLTVLAVSVSRGGSVSTGEESESVPIGCDRIYATRC